MKDEVVEEEIIAEEGIENGETLVEEKAQVSQADQVSGTEPPGCKAARETWLRGDYAARRREPERCAADTPGKRWPRERDLGPHWAWRYSDARRPPELRFYLSGEHGHRPHNRNGEQTPHTCLAYSLYNELVRR